jgi:1,4-dihydroxy-2-naphthoyl-CoA hydrolase
MSNSLLQNLRDQAIKGKLPELIGLDLVEASRESLQGELKVDERHLRPGEIMNGGVSLMLIEIMGSLSAYLQIDPIKQNTFGLNVSANHIAVARPGDVLTITTKSVHIGKTTQIWDVLITNQATKLICSGRITLLTTTHSS